MKRLAVLTVAGVALVAGACSSSAPTAAQAKAPITQAYNKLFNFSDKSLTDKEAVVEDGKSLGAALEQGLTSPLASGVAGATVSSVKILDDATCNAKKVATPCATVAYSIVASNGTPVLAGQTGYATYATGKWLVAKVTICGLLDSLYSVTGHSGTPPGCSA
jgi:hypothetical protein